MKAKVGQDIYIKVSITNIKRDPALSNNATWEEKVIFFDKIREIYSL